jgi:hypothetical protein
MGNGQAARLNGVFHVLLLSVELGFWFLIHCWYEVSCKLASVSSDGVPFKPDGYLQRLVDAKGSTEITEK